MNYSKVYMNHVHSSSLLCQLSAMWKCQMLCDAVIKTGNVTTKAHRVILVASCPMLQSMENATSGSHLEVRLSPDIKQHSINTFLQYLYEGYMMLTEENCRDVEKIARILQVDSVTQCCSDFQKCLKTSSSGQYKYTFPEQTEFRHVRSTDFVKLPDKTQKRQTSTTSFLQSAGAKRQRIQEPFSPSLTGSLSGSEENSGPSDQWDRLPGSQPGVIDIREDTVEFVQTEPPGQSGTMNKQSMTSQSSVSISVASQHNAGVDKRVINVTEDIPPIPPSTTVPMGTDNVKRLQKDSQSKGSQEVFPMVHPHPFSETSRIPRVPASHHTSSDNSTEFSSHGAESIAPNPSRHSVAETNIASSHTSNIKTFPVSQSSGNNAGQVYPVALMEVSRSPHQLPQHSAMPFAAGSESQTALTERNNRPSQQTPRKVSQSFSSGRTDMGDTSWVNPTSKSSSFDMSASGSTIDLTSDSTLIKSEPTDDPSGAGNSVTTSSSLASQSQSDAGDLDQSGQETYHFEEPPGGDWSALGNMSSDGNMTTGDPNSSSFLDSSQDQTELACRAGIYDSETAFQNQMIEIVPNTNVYIPKASQLFIFHRPNSRKEIATRLLRCFYSVQEMQEAVSLKNLKSADVIVNAIISCAMNFICDLEPVTYSKIRKALHNVINYYCRCSRRKDKQRRDLDQSAICAAMMEEEN